MHALCMPYVRCNALTTCFFVSSFHVSVGLQVFDLNLRQVS